jgi:uncharacterized protein (DUF362 family)
MAEKREGIETDAPASSGVDRRTFIKVSAATAVALSAGGAVAQDAPAEAETFVPASHPGRIVRVGHPGALSDPTSVTSDPDPAVVATMVDTAVMAIAGTGDIGSAWRAFIHPSDRVMIKINALASPTMATNRAVVEPIIRGLQAMGLPNDQMVVYDQYGNRMRRAGFRSGDDIEGVAVEYNRTRGYEDEAIAHGSGESKFAVTASWATAIINVPVIKDHDLCGVTMAMKNITHGVIEEPSTLHRVHRRTQRECAVHADVYTAAPLAGKVRLVVVDGLRLMYDGGPQDNDNKIPHNAIYTGTDPIALDTMALDLIEAARAERGLRTLEADGRGCFWLAVCEARGLGIHDRSRIAIESHDLT